MHDMYLPTAAQALKCLFLLVPLQPAVAQGKLPPRSVPEVSVVEAIKSPLSDYSMYGILTHGM